MENIVTEKEQNEVDLRNELDRITQDKVRWHEECKQLRQKLTEVERDN